MKVLKPGESLVAHETDIRSGNIGFFGVNDAYDLYLAKLSSGNYKLIVFMKLQFFFDDGKKLKWTQNQKTTFVNNWIAVIQQKWGNRAIKSLQEGKFVRIDFRFQIQIGGWMFDHWEITVKKIPHGAFKRSSVNPITGNVNLDSEDLTLVSKGRGFRQRGVVHEFGHMLGLEDEYKDSSPHKTDYRSVMNRGELALARHDNVYMQWLETALKSHGIK